MVGTLIIMYVHAGTQVFVWYTVLSRNCENLSTPYFASFSYALVSQNENETMNDIRTGVVNKSYQNNKSVVAHWYCLLGVKVGTYILPVLMDLMLVCRKNIGEFQNLNSVQVKLFTYWHCSFSCSSLIYGVFEV